MQTAKKPDMRMILRSILSQIHQQQSPEAYKVPDLIHDIRKHLQDKRFLLALCTFYCFIKRIELFVCFKSFFVTIKFTPQSLLVVATKAFFLSHGWPYVFMLTN